MPHAATLESGKTFLTEDEEGQEPIWLRGERYGGPFAVERASGRRRVGEIRWVKPRPPPKPAPRRIVSDMNIDPSETFEVSLFCLDVRDDYRTSD